MVCPNRLCSYEGGVKGGKYASEDAQKLRKKQSQTKNMQNPLSGIATVPSD